MDEDITNATIVLLSIGIVAFSGATAFLIYVIVLLYNDCRSSNSDVEEQEQAAIVHDNKQESIGTAARKDILTKVDDVSKEAENADTKMRKLSFAMMKKMRLVKDGIATMTDNVAKKITGKDETNTQECPKCRSRFPDLTQLSVHVVENMNKLYCGEDGPKFQKNETKRDLSAIVEEDGCQTETVQEISCKHCSKKVLDKDALTLHFDLRHRIY